MKPIIAVYRVRMDGDADFVAAFEREQVSDFGPREDEAGLLAQDMVDIIKGQGDEGIIIEFDGAGDLVDVYQGCPYDPKGEE